MIAKTWQYYLAPGLLLGGVKFLSIFSWFFYQPIAAMLGLSTHSFSASDSVTILLLGVIGAIITFVAWPLVIYKLFTGSVSLSAVLFYPWINPN
jgi:hypothetical protein